MKYLPTRLLKSKRKGKAYWIIIFYQTDPISGELKRHRETHGMNRLKNLRARQKYANEVMIHINERLKDGYPHILHSNEILQQVTKISEAIDIALKIKCSSDREQTRRAYRSKGAHIKNWLESQKLSDISVVKFNRNLAMKYLDYIHLEKKVSPTTWNNYLRFSRAMFTELIERGYIEKNPFNGIKRKKESGSKRIPMSDIDKKIVAMYIHDKDRLLLLAILLMYYCLLRPIELLRLQFRHFDLKNGTIVMPGKITKNKNNSIVTIPIPLLEVISTYDFQSKPKKSFLFGTRWKFCRPGNTTIETLRTRYLKCVNYLKENEKINADVNTHLYLWKYMGGQDIMKQNVSMITLVKHFRHSKAETTQIYLNSYQGADEEIRNIKNKLL